MNKLNMFNECTSAEEAIFQALGAASVCWENIEQAGIFESTRAKLIGDELIERLVEFGLEEQCKPCFGTGKTKSYYRGDTMLCSFCGGSGKKRGTNETL